VWKYDPDYIKYGFIKAGNDIQQKAQCVECAKILLNESFKPLKLERHQNAHHPWSAMKSKQYFARKRDGLHAQQQVMTLYTTQSKSALNASYTVAGCVACSKKAFTIAEELILPSAINMSQEVIGEAAASKLELVSLSNNTTTRRIEIRDDIECQLLERIKIQSVLFHTIGWIYWLYQCSFIACIWKVLCWQQGLCQLTFLPKSSHKNNCCWDNSLPWHPLC